MERYQVTHHPPNHFFLPRYCTIWHRLEFQSREGLPLQTIQAESARLEAQRRCDSTPLKLDTGFD